MSDDLARLLYDGAVAVREGRRADAQGLLMRVIERDEANELAWLWLSGAVDDPADQQVALENVLALNPGNTAARQGLELAAQRHQAIGAEVGAAAAQPVGRVYQPVGVAGRSGQPKLAEQRTRLAAIGLHQLVELFGIAGVKLGELRPLG